MKFILWYDHILKNLLLLIADPPGPATLVYEPRRVVKNGAVTLSCSVEDVGRPESTAFRWKRGNHIVPDVTSGNWSIELVTLESESNFTCYAVNEGGDGQPATTYIDVLGMFPNRWCNCKNAYLGCGV